MAKKKAATKKTARRSVVDLDSLTLDPGNACVHSDRNMSVISSSLDQFGAGRSVLMDGDGIIRAGNGTVQAARGTGRVKKARIIETDGSELIVVKRTDLHGAEAVALGLADNRASDLHGYDADQLQTSIDEAAQAVDIDLDAIGFSELDVDALLSSLDSVDDDDDQANDETPEPPTGDPDTLRKRFGVADGQLWQIKSADGVRTHRLFVGDSRSERNVQVLNGDGVPNLMVTDPPYNNDDEADWSVALHLFRGPVAYVWHADKFAATVFDALAAEFDIRSQIIWAKPSLVISRGHYHFQHEPCFYAVRKKDKAYWSGDRKQSTLWQIAGMTIMGAKASEEHDAKTGHSTQKPVECMARAIRNHGDESWIVYDPFVGSGTTMVAAERELRTCHAMETDPKFAAIALQRMVNLGGKPQLVS